MDCVHIGVKAGITLMFGFSGVALQICFSKRVEKGEPDRTVIQDENCCQKISFGKGE